MSEYIKEIEFLKRVEAVDDETNFQRKKFTPSELEELTQKYPGVPKDYLNYLKEVGAGTFRECQFAVYDFLGTLEDIFGDIYDFDENVLFFGDNFSGDMAGFHLDHNWSVVEFLHETEEVEDTNMTFHEYIRHQMLMNEDGSDRRRKRD